MALEQKLNLKLTQKLMMTPQLQQAIKLLQYQRLELGEVLTQEVVENPVLEEAQETPESEQPEQDEKPVDKEPEVEIKDTIDEFDYEAYFQDYLDSSYAPKSSEVPADLPTTENTLAQTVSLAEHLLWQLNEIECPEPIEEIARAIIGNLDNDGYLVASSDEIRAMGPYSKEHADKALRVVQHLDPVGVASSGLQDCLLIQLRHYKLGTADTQAIITDHLELVRKHRLDEIAKRLDLTVEEVRQHLDIIRHLDPKPGIKHSSESSNYVEPDVHVRKVDGEYQIVLNEEGLPKLRISPIYRRLLAQKDQMTTETRQYVNEKFKAALWLIRSLDQRQRTIFKVAESIVKYQHDFLDRGIDFLRPLVLRDVAEDIGMHESTVSRVVTNKYMHTPQGLFEMKYFFHSSIQSESGVDVSSLAVKKKIRKYIEDEDPARPLSDSKIVKLLKAEGLEIARRTVAKYREELKIPSSTYRRRIYH